ncbi:MAG: PepSY domain-containing protein, partial [Candidatus Rokuibacteriota bacterium]
LARAEQQVPGWVAITLRLPQRPAAPVVAVVQERPAWHPAPRSLLTLDASSAAVVSWEPFAAQNLGRRLRSWVRPLHAGEAAGVVGQAVAGLASTGGAFLVYTGVALAWRRFRGWTGAARPVLGPRSLSDDRQQVSGLTHTRQPRSTTHGG